MRFDEFRKLYMKKMERDYEQRGNEWHAKMLCYCRHRVLNEPYEVVASKDTVMVGQLIHIGVEEIAEYVSRVYRKKAGGYVVYGTPDLIVDGELVEIKFTVYPPKEPREHDVMQLRIYMWLLDKDKGYLWYISPFGSREFEVEGKYDDDYVVWLIENPQYPMHRFECKYCSLYPCKYTISNVFVGKVDGDTTGD